MTKSSTSKCKFSDFPLLALKFTKFVMLFLKPRASFSSNFASLSTLMRDNSSVLFHLKLYMLSTKGTHQVQIFNQLLALKLTKYLAIFQATSHFSLKLHFGQKEPIKVQIFKFLSALMKVHPIPHANFETTRLRFIQILHHCSLYFLSQTFILWTKRAHRSEIFRLLSGWVKIQQIPSVMFETTSQFFFKLFITLQCHEKLFCTFLAETVHDFDKRSPSKCKISDFPLVM